MSVARGERVRRAIGQGEGARVEADRFDSQVTFDRFQRVDDEARARIRNR
jgi:hypothetical protein